MEEQKSDSLRPAWAMAYEVRGVAAALAGHGNILPELFSLAFEIVKHAAQKPKPITPEKANVTDYIAIREAIQKISRIESDPRTPHEKVELIREALREYYSQ